MQDLLAISIVILAATYLAHRAWRHLILRTTGACDSCSNCRMTEKSRNHQLITISTVATPVKSRR
jgi:hypothetical protein